MEGTDTPISFASLACCECQANEQALSCVQCVSSSGLEGSGPTPTFQQGKSVTTFVPSSPPSLATCGLLQPWGSCVIVGKRYAGNEELAARSVESTRLDVLIDRQTSMAGNPFMARRTGSSCTRAFDEMLAHILLNDLNFDRVLSRYHRLFDDFQSGTSRSEPVMRRLLLEISLKHDVEVNEAFAQLLTADSIRSWVAHHAVILRSGQHLRLLGHDAEGSCPPWTCHGQSLAGALLWVCQRMTTVRRLHLGASIRL